MIVTKRLKKRIGSSSCQHQTDSIEGVITCIMYLLNVLNNLMLLFIIIQRTCELRINATKVDKIDNSVMKRHTGGGGLKNVKNVKH